MPTTLVLFRQNLRLEDNRALAFAADGKVKADIELQPLSAINKVFERLARGEVPSRVVLDFSPR